MKKLFKAMWKPVRVYRLEMLIKHTGAWMVRCDRLKHWCQKRNRKWAAKRAYWME